MILSHFTYYPFIFDPNRTYKDPTVFKPNGLWLSDESDYGWKKWCMSNDWNLPGLKFETRFELVHPKDVLIIQGNKDIQEFQAKYKLGPGSKAYLDDWIRWSEVKKDFAGIIITPYLWEYRLSYGYGWYYTWDCASGCIWDLSVVRAL